MSIKIMSDVWDSDYAKESHARLLVMLKLADHASDDGECYPSQSTIAKKCGLARPTVNRIILELVKDGKIELEKSNGRHNRYTLRFSTPVTVDDTPCHPTLHPLSSTVTPPVILRDTNHHITTNEPSMNQDVATLFEFWKTTMSLNGSTLLTPKREKAIQSRIKQGYSIERIKNAIRGCASSPFNMGVNERHTKYNDIELICRTGEKVEYYEQMIESTGPVKTISDEEIKMREALLASQEMGKIHYEYE